MDPESCAFRSDNHDVYSFETYNLDSAEQQQRAYEQSQQQQQQYQQQQHQQNQEEPGQVPQEQPAAAQETGRFDDILSKLNNIGEQQNNEQPPQQQYDQTQNFQQAPPPPQQQQQNFQPPQQQQQQQQNFQQQPPQQQQQQYNPPQPPPPVQQQQAQHYPPVQQQQTQQPQQQYAQQSAGYYNDILKDIVAGLSDVSSRLNNLQQTVHTSSGSGSAGGSVDNSRQIDQILQQQRVIAEAFGNLLKSVALKTDLDATQQQYTNLYNTFTRELSETRTVLNDLKATVNSKLGTKSDDIIRTLEDVSQNVNVLKKGVEQTRESTKQIAGNLQQNQQEIATTIEKSTSFGFWTYFLFVQAIFIFGFIWWKKHRDDANKKIL